MSVVTVEGRSFAAGLYWLERSTTLGVISNARRFRRHSHVHWSRQTGYADKSADGLPSLAAALLDHVPGDFWMALVEGHENRFALVKVREGSILADGDEVFDDRASALQAFEKARGVGWALYASRGLVQGPVVDLDTSVLSTEPDLRLRPVPLAGSIRHVSAAIIGLAATTTAAFLFPGDGLLNWIIGDPKPEVPRAEPSPLSVIIDSTVFLEACRQALLDHTPFLPAWETRRITCHARFDETTLVAVRPELADLAVLVVNWTLQSGRAVPVHRRIAEARLSEWYAASVTDSEAWAVAILEPVLRTSESPPPDFLSFRRSLDRRLGARNLKVEFRADGPGALTIRTGQPVHRFGDLISGIPGLEVTRLTSRGNGEWRIEARREQRVRMPQSEFNRVRETLQHET